jgi:hypothetical protein
MQICKVKNFKPKHYFMSRRTEVKTIKSLKDLVPDDKNANQGSVRGRAMLETSVEQYGAGRSLLADRNGKLIAGNKSQEVYIDKGIEDCIVVQTDGKTPVVVQRVDLDLDKDPRARELAVMDNRTNEVSLTWDGEVLNKLQQEGTDLSKAFDEIELKNIVALSEANLSAAANMQAAPPEFPSFDENLPTEHQCPKCGYSWSGKAKAKT